jgi:hypothetical protein
MGRKKATIEELSARSQAKDYTPGAHHAQDSIKDKKTSVAKTLEDQDSAVEQFQK